MARTVSLKKLIWETVTSHKFETWLVGIKGDEYCVGYVKGSESACQRAKEKYTDGSVWSLSKVTFDNYSDAKYISTPIPFRVDLGKSTLTLLSGDSAPEVAEHAVLPRSVADVKRITTTRGTDVIAVLKEVSKERHQTKKSGEDVADITLVDNSNATAGSSEHFEWSSRESDGVLQPIGGLLGTRKSPLSLRWRVGGTRSGVRKGFNSAQKGTGAQGRHEPRDAQHGVHTDSLSP